MHARTLALCLLSLSLAAGGASAQPNAVPDAVRYDGDKIVRVMTRGQADAAALENLGADSWQCRPPASGPTDYRIPKGLMPALEASGIPFQILIQDLQAVVDAEAERIRATRLEGGGAGGTWFNDYKDYAAFNTYMDQLVAAYPAIASRVTIGTSLQGRSISGLRIAAPGAPADRTAVLFHGLQHAREWITGMTAMYMADRLIRCYGTDPQVTQTLQSVQFLVVPIANPDGYSYTWTNQRFWRKNRRTNPNGSVGVDLNRNWGYQWGGEGASATQGSDTYRGPSAFSEPETQALRDFITARPYIRAHIDLHSYSQLMLSPFGYATTLPADRYVFADLNELMRTTLQAVHGTPFVAGPTYTTIYPASGVSSDWTYGSRGILGWGFELRDTGTFGFALPAAQIIPSGEETYAAIMALAEAVGRPLRFTFPDGLPTALNAGQSESVRVVVTPMASGVNTASPTMRYRIGRTGEFSSFLLSHASGTEYFASLPAAGCGAEISYAFQATTTGGQVIDSPTVTVATVLTQPAPQIGTVGCTPCPADFNRDGDPNPDDLGDYITCYFTEPPCTFANFNSDSDVNPDDLGDFITAYFLGC